MVSCNLDEQSYVTGRESDQGEGKEGLKFGSLFVGRDCPPRRYATFTTRPLLMQFEQTLILPRRPVSGLMMACTT